MARIELRHATIRVKDGFSGTAAVNESTTPPADGDTLAREDVKRTFTSGPGVNGSASGQACRRSARRYAHPRRSARLQLTSFPPWFAACVASPCLLTPISHARFICPTYASSEVLAIPIRLCR